MHQIIKISTLFTFVCLAYFANSQQVENTTVTCLEVLPDGSVEITWTPIPDVNGIFQQYQIGRHDTSSESNVIFYSDTDVNAFTHIDNDISVNANLAPECYQIVVAPTSGPASLSNVLCTMLLSGNFTAGSGIANLAWTPPTPSYSEVPAGSIYKVLEEYPVGDWHEVAAFNYSPDINSFDHPVSVCDDAANYRIELCFPGETCSSLSNIITLNVSDESPPPTPQITSISVDTITGQAIVDWNTVNAPDCSGYVVTWCDAPGLPQEQIISDCNVTEFAFPTANPGSSPQHFLVASFDTCSVSIGDGNTSITEGNCPYIHSSIFLGTSWSDCQDFIDLVWSPYTGWGNNGISTQEIYRRDNGGNSELIGTISGDVFTFRDNFIEDNHSYCYFIKAYSATVNNEFSISNIACRTVLSPILPSAFNIFTATVGSPDEIAVIATTDITAFNFDYVLLRKSDKDPFFQEIDLLTTNEPPVQFIDNDVDPEAFYYDYQIGLVNICNDTVAYSNIGRTIKVQGLANDETLINTITWNAYIDWENGVDNYEVYRTIDDGLPELIAVNNPGVLYLEDDVSQYLDSKGQFCYYVVAKEGANTLGTSAESYSNILCLSQPPKIWIPNAIAVNGINDEFFPRISFADRDTYRMVIYNRWGQEFFMTTDINDSWDGTKNGNLVQEGAYMYYIEISDGSGQLYEFRGPVNILIFDAN